PWSRWAPCSSSAATRCACAAPTGRGARLLRLAAPGPGPLRRGLRQVSRQVHGRPRRRAVRRGGRAVPHRLLRAAVLADPRAVHAAHEDGQPAGGLRRRAPARERGHVRQLPAPAARLRAAGRTHVPGPAKQR
ncbi:unnamed protein product, partial [Prorocentrum cordatum]